MNKSILIFFITMILFLSKNNSFYDNNIIEKQKKDIFSTKKEFTFFVENVLNKGFRFDKESIIINIKVYNSINSYDLSKEVLFKKFNTEFENEYLKKKFKLFDFDLSIGMGLYSKKYKIHIGGIKFIKGSYMTIKDLNK